ncbi:MAG: sigma-70 family RNA polymerase sigma factor [Phycisphaerales bacterium]|jgi:RNA polymerase sigma-70 factor (ECF subfamily)
MSRPFPSDDDTPLGGKERFRPDDSLDLALVEQIRRGEPAGWTAIIARYQNRLFSVCLRMVHNREMAADLTQDSFVKIIQGIGSFDGRSKLSTWMIRITMNVCLSKLRSEKLRRHASLDAIQDGTGSGGRSEPGRARGFEQSKELGAEESVEADEEKALVLAALRELDPEQRAVLILCDSQGQSYDQIAEVMNVAVGTIKSRLFRARTALREAVEAKMAARGRAAE